MESVGEDKQIVDLVGFMAHPTQANREGICW
jgi:GDP-mannose 6-dehydrogenase